MRAPACLALVAMFSLAAPPARAEDVDIGANLEVILDAPFSENQNKPNAAGGSLTVQRGSLDTTVVVELVRERLHRAAVRAAVKAIREARGEKDLRPWMTDLLGIVVRLATTRDHSAQLSAEALLRLGGRVLLAHVVVETSLGGRPADERYVYENWVYWRLSRPPLLVDAVARPTCVGPGASACAAWKDLDDGAAIVAIDKATKVGDLLGAIDSLRRLQKKIAGRNLALSDVLAELEALSPRLSSLGLVPADITKLVDQASAGFAGYEALRVRGLALAASLTNLAKAFAAYQQTGTPAQLAAVRNALREVQDLLARQVVGTEAFIDVLVTVSSTFPGVAAVVGDLAEDLRELSKMDSNALETTLAKALADAWPSDLVARVQAGFADRVMPNVTGALTAVRTAIAELARVRAALDLRTLTVASAPDVGGALEQAAIALDKLVSVVDAVGYGTTVERDALRAAARRARQAANWCKLAFELTPDDADATTRLAAAQELLAGLRGADGAMPLVAMLTPVLDDIVAAGKLEPRHLLAAFARLDGSALLDTFGLPRDVDATCKEREGAACWSSRLLLLVRSSITVDGNDVEIHTDAVVRDLADLVGRPRDRPFTPYLHLAVGTGLLFHSAGTADEPAPLIAEQIGVGMKLAGNDSVTLRASAYGSGLLYRLVLDSRESDGVMFGGGLMLDLFGDIELFATTAVLIAPVVEADDKSADWISTVGVQVPLADYLERLGD